MTARYATEIGRGVDEMDRVDPGWWREGNIDAEELNLADPRKCVVGQRYGGRYKLGWIVMFGHDPVNPPSHYGFGPGFGAGADYGVLTREWREKIYELRRTRGVWYRRLGAGLRGLFVPRRSPVIDPALTGWFLDRNEACTSQIAA